MCQKHDIATQQVNKWKARLNFDGSSMKKGVHYKQSYGPVTSWGSIQLALAIEMANNWVPTQVDYVLAFPQAPVEHPIYMDIPCGFEMAEGLSKRDYALLLHGNVYGQKQAAHVWNKYLTKCLVNQAEFAQELDTFQVQLCNHDNIFGCEPGDNLYVLEAHQPEEDSQQTSSSQENVSPRSATSHVQTIEENAKFLTPMERA